MEYHSQKDYDRFTTKIPKEKLEAHKRELEELLLKLPMPVQSSINDFKDDHSDKKPVRKPKAKENLSKEKQRLLDSFDGLPKESQTIILKLIEKPIWKPQAEEKLSKEKQRLLDSFDTLPKESRTIILKLVEDFAKKVSSTNSVD